MTAPGEFALVLHTHLPWLRGHGVWPVGEEWLFQAWGCSWLPVTRMLEELAEDGQREILTLGVTPTVAQQVADPRLAADLGTWLGGQMWRAEEQRWHHYLDERITGLHSFHWRRFATLLDHHQDVQRRGGLLAVWSDLANRGVIELLAGPATHPYLPLQRDPALIDAQLRSGLDHHARWSGQPARGLWPPELGYRPRGAVVDATVAPDQIVRFGTSSLPRTGPELPGLEEHYARHGIDHILVDGPTLIRAAGGADRDWTVRPDLTTSGTGHADEVVRDGAWIGDSDVATFARDLAVAYHVWSPRGGYPGNEWYRDSYARGSFGVHPSWRVTAHDVHPTAKAPYEPDAAAAQVHRDVEHLHAVLRRALDPHPGALAVAAYDTELFGHWWFEGVDWLRGLLVRIAEDPDLVTTTLQTRLERRPPTRRLHLPESSWGYGKGHANWVSPDTRWYWQTLADARERARTVLANGRGAQPLRAQVARELALLASSDWAFMTIRGQTPRYARERILGHADLLAQLCAAIADDEPAVELLAHAQQLDAAPPDPAAFVHALDPANSMKPA